MGSFLSRTLLMAFGYAYPAYDCFKAVENNKPEIQQLRFWCQYWLPLYNEVKLAFVVYLCYPKWKGTTYVYDSFLRPYVVKHETEIDRNLFELKVKAREFGFLYWHRAVSYGQTRFFEVLQYCSSQEASETYLDQQQQNLRKAEPPASSQAFPAKTEQLKQPLPDSSSLSEEQFDRTNEPGFHIASQSNKRMISGQSCVKKTTSQLLVSRSETRAIQPTSTSSLGNGDSNSSQEQTSYKEAVTRRRGFTRKPLAFDPKRKKKEEDNELMETSTATGTSLKKKTEQVLDGSDLMELVENKEVFSSFVDHKFKELDEDSDGQLSVKVLQPAVADIGAALGLPAQGSSPDSDHIYSEVLNEFTHGKQEKVSKTEFKEVLSDILLGMAAGLKRDPIVILRIDGEDLLEFINGPSYEAEMVSLFSQIGSDDISLRDCIIKALKKLTVDQGMPPSDSWVMSNIVEPALQSWDGQGNDQEKPLSQETFLEEFKKVAERVAQNLKEQPVIVAHSENTFDGSGIKRLLSNKFELDKSLNTALENVPKDSNGKISNEYLRVVLDVVAPSAGLPPIGAVEQIDKVVADVFNMINADDEKMVKEDEFKKLLAEILGSIMLHLEGNPISVSSNSVVHEPLASSSSLLQPSS
ncbi:hypothetical protein CRYUN_Cryun10bG0141100 [Craigia yunnanensis]